MKRLEYTQNIQTARKTKNHYSEIGKLPPRKNIQVFKKFVDKFDIDEMAFDSQIGFIGLKTLLN